MLGRLRFVLRLWFGVTEPVRPLAYATTGLLLTLIKYAVEASVFRVLVLRSFTVWDFFNPLITSRAELLKFAPQWIAWAWLLWTLPFLWVALSMSVRRAANAGVNPRLGLLVVLPLVNLILMFVLAVLPESPDADVVQDAELERPSPFGQSRQITSGPAIPPRPPKVPGTIVGIAASTIVGGLMMIVSVYLLSDYGSSLFLGTPVVMGVTASYIANRRVPRSYGASFVVGFSAVIVGGLALLLFALEGLICVVMAMPLVVPLGGLGGLLGKVIAEATRVGQHAMAACILVLPLSAAMESMWRDSAERCVATSIVIDAPAESVWQQVLYFPEITSPPAWFFRTGIACPQRARIEGEGVGAVRYCEFTTGAFVEPITAWEAPSRLAFDVSQQPAPMYELTPYRHVHPPHLEHALVSKRGEFRLIRLDGGKTRLEGRTWYTLDMAPGWYWQLWTDAIIHRIHQRVLEHVGRCAEQSAS